MAGSYNSSNYTSYPDCREDGANQDIGWIQISSYPLPKIPSNANLYSVKLTFNMYRTQGHKNGTLYLELDGSSDRRIASISVPKETNTPVDIELYSSYVSADANGNLSPIGFSTISLHGQHNTGLFFNSWWETTNAKITAYYTIYTYTLTVTAGTGGTVTGSGTYDNKATATLTATPNTGYKFKQWNDGNTSATRTITVTSDATYTATFEKLTYAVSTSVSPTNGGTVTGGGTYGHDDTATLTATPATGYRFKCWQDDTSNTNATRNVTVTGAVTYTAVFERLTYRVRWYNEDGSVLLETDDAVPYGDTPSCSVTPTKAATAQYTYTHIGWAVSPTAENTTGLTAVVANIDYYARFRADINKYTVTWKNDDGTVLETDTLVPYGNPPDYNGATPTKASTAQYDYTFLGWSAEVFEGSREEENLPSVSGNIIYTAVYLPVVRKYDLDIVAYDCTVEGAVSGTYEYGTKFTIEVNPDFGYEFDRILDETNDVEYIENEVEFYLNGDITLLCFCKRASAPIFISPEQQVKMVYIVPAINTIVYQVEGDLPTLETTMHTVDDWHFDVINTDIDTKYGIYAYYEAEQLYINETRIY